MIVKVFIGPNNYDISQVYLSDENEYIIGVDYGAYKLFENKIPIDLAIGDFDSVTNWEFNCIKNNAKEIIKLSKNKDETDTYKAITHALNMKPEHIIIYGGIGKRQDHFLANVNLLKMGNISMINNDTKVFILEKGIHSIENTYQYISFFAIEDIDSLTLRDFSYELDGYHLSINDSRCISNEGSGVVEFHQGKLLVIMSNE